MSDGVDSRLAEILIFAPAIEHASGVLADAILIDDGAENVDADMALGIASQLYPMPR